MKHTKMGVAVQFYFSPFGHKNEIIKPTGWRGNKVHILFPPDPLWLGRILTTIVVVLT